MTVLEWRELIVRARTELSARKAAGRAFQEMMNRLEATPQGSDPDAVDEFVAYLTALADAAATAYPEMRGHLALMLRSHAKLVLSWFYGAAHSGPDDAMAAPARGKLKQAGFDPDTMQDPRTLSNDEALAMLVASEERKQN